MDFFKENIAKNISEILNIDEKEIASNLEIPKNKANGDYSFPCFKLSKTLHKSPQMIADFIKENYNDNENLLEKIENINGFLNFYVLKQEKAKKIVEKFASQDKDYGKNEKGKGKKVIVEYSSPNIAKPFHIGHLKNTVLGQSLYNIYKFSGYETIGINHLGDYGTQFAKLIVGYKMWGDEYDFSTDAIEKLADIYKRINELCEKDENVLDECRQTFKLLENGDEYCTKIWKQFKDLSMKEFNQIYDILGVKFDYIIGESFYTDKMQEVIDLLEKSGKLEESKGAKIVDLTDEGIDTPCIIQKSNGTSIYATRDLAAILYRARTFDFDKCLYVVGIEQSLHFKQVFAVAKYLGLDKKYLDGLTHVSYGMIRLPEGKMSTRKGNFVKAKDLLDDAFEKASDKIKDRDNIEGKEKVAKQVAVGAVIFDNLKESRNQEQVFDINKALNFSGETGPYIQYMVVRTNGILKNVSEIPEEKDIDFSVLTDEKSLDVLNLIGKFEETINLVIDKNEPSILTRYLLDLAESFASFYGKNKVISDDKNVQDARIYLTYMVKVTLTNGLKLLGIQVPDKM